MMKRVLDSSTEKYILTETPKNHIKQLRWDIAIGLQEVDNLKPSKYLENLMQENILGKKTIYEIEYELKYIHQYLFKDIYEFAGKFRKVNISKSEKILNYDSVAYGDYKLLEKSLDYDITIEKTKDYKQMNMSDLINNITKFSSNIWQVHPFREGNTRTVAMFIIKYLEFLEYNIDKTLFKDNSLYYRSALVRSNYFNDSLNIRENNSFLIKFYEMLIFGKNNNLRLEELVLEESSAKENEKLFLKN